MTSQIPKAKTGGKETATANLIQWWFLRRQFVMQSCIP
jgi:hypothetical protein